MQWLCSPRWNAACSSRSLKMPPLRPTHRCSAHLKERARQGRSMASSSSKASAPAPHTKSQHTKPPGTLQWGTTKRSARGRGGKGRAAPSAPPTQSLQQRGQPPTDDSQSTTTGNVNWDNSPILTTNLIQWLLSHPADRHILFHDCASSTHVPVPGDRPSGRNKKEVQAVIAKHLFEKDPTYSSAYTLDPGRFSTSLNNRLST